MSSNTISGDVSRPVDVLDAILRVLPAEIKNFFLYEANSSYDMVDIFRAWRAGVPVERIMRDMRLNQRDSTVKTYGWTHPNSKIKQG